MNVALIIASPSFIEQDFTSPALRLARNVWQVVSVAPKSYPVRCAVLCWNLSYLEHSVLLE